MSLDAEHTKLTRLGKVEVTADGIVVTGFAGENCTCRDVAVLAATWAIGELQRELLRTIERPGGGNIGID